MFIANAEQIRKADQIMMEKYGFPGLLLMETAGRKAAEFILGEYANSPEFLVLAGPGNNGGDGLVIARYLHLAGKVVSILLSHSPQKYKGDAQINWDALQGSGISTSKWSDKVLPEIRPQTVLIDALLGTGLHAAPHGAIAEMVAHFRTASGPVVAIDLPSGLSADTGRLIDGAEPLPAHHTLTFQLPKLCHYLSPASTWCGLVVTIDIGIWPAVMAELGLQRKLLYGAEARLLDQAPALDAHKGSQGHALLIGGSRLYAGAIALSAHAALAAGAGLSTALTPETARVAVYEAGPEVMVKAFPGDWLGPNQAAEAAAFIRKTKPKAIGIGPGLGREDAASFLEAVLSATGSCPLVLDADALNALADQPRLWAKLPKACILTPHPGEFRRLTGRDVAQAGRLESAEAFVQKHPHILVLKGAHTLVAGPDGQTFLNFSGNPGMATAGSGDVLTGIITALLARGHAPFSAAALGVYLHGLAGDLAIKSCGQDGLTASAILKNIGPAFLAIRQQSEPIPVII